MKARYYGIAALLVVVVSVAFAVALPSLPAQVPVHWNALGRVDRLASPWTLFAVGPGIMAATMALFALLPVLSPRRFELESFERTYLAVMLIIVGLVGYTFLVALEAGLHGTLDVPRALVGGLCVMSILLGNLLGKVRRNFYVGIRTPWTLASERVWYATHRLGAKVIVATGLAGLVLVIAGVFPLIPAAIAIAGFLVPVVYSLVFYKRLEREGGLEGPARAG